MLALPGTPWRDTPWGEAEALAHAPVEAGPLQPAWALLPGEARHAFTHRALTMRLMAARVPALPPGDAAPLAEAARLLPTAMRGLLALLPG
jgi:A/G-specific adenine glycosylase